MPPIRKIVIPVAGLGTRFLPATKAMPKEMLPIIDKPVIQYVVEEAVASGITDIVLVTSHAKRPIEDHFDENRELEDWLRKQEKIDLLEQVKRISSLANFIYIRQKGPYGNATPVMNAQHIIGNEPFAVVWGDDMYHGKTPRLKQMIEAFETYGETVLGALTVKKEEAKRYGMIDPEEQLESHTYRVKNVIEKPEPSETPSLLASCAGYIFTPEIFTELKRLKPGHGGEYVTLDAVHALMKRRPVFAREIIDNEYFDTGTKVGWLRANLAMALQREDLAQETKTMIQSMHLS